MKKKILHVLASSSFSGAESVAITIITNMDKKYDMAYTSPTGKIEKKLKQNNITYYGIKKLNIFELKKTIREYNPDIIHAHDYRASFLCALLKGKKKLILHIHNNAPWIKKSCLKSMIFLFSSKRADKILIVSNSIKNEYIFSKIVKDKFICIGNPVSSKNIISQVDNNQIQKKYDICCIARISRVKDPITFLNIICKLKKKIPNIIAIWIGGNDDIVYTNSILNEVKKLKLEKNVKFLGWKEDPYTYMIKSKIFLLTSKYEGYGLAAFEALSLGLPCVVSNVGGLPSVVDDSCGKLCEKGNVNQFYDEVIKLLTEKSYYLSKSQNAILKSNQLSNLEKYCKKLKQVYKGVCDE